MTTAKVWTFRSDDSEVIEIPEEMAFGVGVDLTLERHGDVLTIYPTRFSGAELVATLDAWPPLDEVKVRDDELPKSPAL